MKNTLFDQYQRYNNIRKIINEMRCGDESFRILEVGANEHRNLENFLPIDKITYLDIQLPEELQHDPNYILGDATNMEFPDDEYDVIVALDVFEHIPLEKRNQFIDELYRVSSQVCIITAPFHSEQSIDAESRVNSVYKSLFKKNFIWLEEHMDNGLPNKDSLKEYLELKNIKYMMIGHGRISIWEKLMGIHFFAAKNPELAVYRQEIDRFYNSHIFDHDYTEDSYRKVVILEKGRNLNLSFKTSSEIPSETLQTLEMMEHTFYNLCSMIGGDKEGDLCVDKVQIFIDSGAGFTESDSENFQFNDKELMKFITVDLRDFEVIKSIRIDPSDYCGFYKIDNLRLIGANNDTEIKYQVSGNFDIKKSNVYLFEKDDPNIILNFESEVDIVRIEFYISKLSITEIVNQYVSMSVSKENEITSINSEYKQQLEMKEANEQVLKKENENYQRMNETLVDDLADKGRLNEKLNDEIEHLRAANILYETEKQKLIQELEIKEHELSSIYKSKAWKLVIKARKVLGK
ncbi:methyltransferase domain-containing protein [Paenibacillus sp. VTT E-133280]|uniref:methyltransferase domain-containing protein n=1 Tax=Paenibacillus sp. VTT E-133280 TaxID=1986222 RepID=UPI0015C64709|nr:methyltransferase domain-containing protein [Paenibacillus sp. VTT E-133280]